MNIYVDLDNLSSYASKGGSEHFAACNEMLRKNFNIHFTFSKTTLENCKKKIREPIMKLMRTLTRARGSESDKLTWESNFPMCPITEDFYDNLNWEQLMSLYWLSDKSATDVQKHGLLMIASVGEELKSLLQLFIDNEALPTKKFPLREMKDWGLLRQHSMPCTDIIIIDPYFFAQSDYLYERNSYQVIAELSHHACGKPLNIVIFTNPQYRLENNGYVDVPFPSILRNLKTLISDICGNEPNITIVKLPKKEEHDRTIITNYKMFVSGDSFTFFDNDGNNTSHARWFDVNSLAHKHIHEQVTRYLKELQCITDTQEAGLMGIVGDKVSNFLTFS